MGEGRLVINAQLDLDIATAYSRRCSSTFPDSLTHGARFGTIGVRIPGNGRTWEVTSLRSEAGYTDGRRPDAVVFGKNIIEDLSRRDFTVNSMAISFPDGEFLDLRWHWRPAIKDHKNRGGSIRAILRRWVEDITRVSISFSLGPMELEQ